MTTYIHDGTAHRKAKEWHIHDGTAWRRVKKAYCHDGTSWRKVFDSWGQFNPSGQPPLSSKFVDHVSGTDIMWAQHNNTNFLYSKPKTDADNGAWTARGASGLSINACVTTPTNVYLMSMSATYRWNGTSWSQTSWAVHSWSSDGTLAHIRVQTTINGTYDTYLLRLNNDNSSSVMTSPSFPVFNTLIYGCYNDRRLYVADNSGAVRLFVWTGSWTQIGSSLPSGAIPYSCLQYSGVTYIVTTGGVYKSTNGTSWTLVSNDFALLTIHSTTDGRIIWAGATGIKCYTVATEVISDVATPITAKGICVIGNRIWVTSDDGVFYNDP